MKEIEPQAMSRKESFAIGFLLQALPRELLRRTDFDSKKALLKLYDSYRRLPAKADQLVQRELRNKAREITPYDFCDASLFMITSCVIQASECRDDLKEYNRLANLSCDWAKRRDLSAGLVFCIKDNSTRLDCTVLRLQDKISTQR